jgi:beta-carotene 3-hydroxylase
MIGALWILIGFVSMELFSWSIHKFIMHGPLWKIHKSHHVHTEGFFERNDLFTLLFASIAIVLIVVGLEQLDYRFWLGCGITLYGFSYFIFHDVLIHRRVKWLKRPKGKYLRAIAEAHKAHHRTNTKEDAVSFGLFMIPKEYFKKQEIS